MPSWQNRLRHFEATSTQTPTRRAISTFSRPSAARSTMRARITSRCDAVPADARCLRTARPSLLRQTSNGERRDTGTPDQELPAPEPLTYTDVLIGRATRSVTVVDVLVSSGTPVPPGPNGLLTIPGPGPKPEGAGATPMSEGWSRRGRNHEDGLSTISGRDSWPTARQLGEARTWATCVARRSQARSRLPACRQCYLRSAMLWACTLRRCC